MNRLLIFFTFFLPISAFGEAVTFSWTNATLRTDGTPLLPAEIVETRIFCNDNLLIAAPGDANSATVEMGAGSYSCHARHVDQNGARSWKSNTVSKTISEDDPVTSTSTSRPRKPTGFTIS